MMKGLAKFPAEANVPTDKDKMSKILELYRNKLFPFHKLEEFMPPNDLSEEDIRRLMEVTGRIKEGEKSYEPFANYLEQKAIFEKRFGEWKGKKIGAGAGQNRESFFKK